MLQRSVTLMRRLSWMRPKPSTSISPHREHSFQGHERALHDLARQFDPWLERLQAIAKLLERVELHVRALAAIAVLVGHVVEALVRRLSLERVVDTALRHHDELIGIAGRAPFDD